MWLWLLWACGMPPGEVPPGGERAAMVEALRALPDDPDRAFAHCLAVHHPPNHADCVMAVVQAAPHHPEARSWCAGLAEEHERNECAFIRSEFGDDLLGCEEAGPWRDECRLHVWRSRVPRLIQPGAGMAVATEIGREALKADGFDPDDPTLWHPVFHHLFEWGAPPEACDEVTGMLAGTCRQVAAERPPPLLGTTPGP